MIHKGHVYWCWRGVYCLDFATGKPLWRGGRFGATGSCLVTGDDRLIVWADRGELVLIETAVRSPSKYTELARKAKVFRRDVWPHLAFCDGRVHRIPACRVAVRDTTGAGDIFHGAFAAGLYHGMEVLQALALAARAAALGCTALGGIGRLMSYQEMQA